MGSGFIMDLFIGYMVYVQQYNNVYWLMGIQWDTN